MELELELELEKSGWTVRTGRERRRCTPRSLATGDESICQRPEPGLPRHTNTIGWRPTVAPDTWNFTACLVKMPTVAVQENVEGWQERGKAT